MDKVNLVLDAPKRCDDCPCSHTSCHSGIWCNLLKKNLPHYGKSEDCPLKTVPEKRHQPQYQGNGVFGYRTAMEHEYARGWNECIDYFVSK